VTNRPHPPTQRPHPPTQPPKITPVTSPNDAWSEEHARWGKRDLSAKRYVYFRADGIHVQARLEDAARPEAARTYGGARARGRRRRARLLAGARGSVAADLRPALLGAKTAYVLNKLPKSQQNVFSHSRFYYRLSANVRSRRFRRHLYHPQ
jgi:hypothetical protein